MTTVPVLRSCRPLAAIAHPPTERMLVRRTLVLAGGAWKATAHGRATKQLAELTGPTRCSGVIVVQYPPIAVLQTLATVTCVDEQELAGARLAAEADHRGGRPVLSLFIASCQVLWAQIQPEDVGFGCLS